LGEVFKNFAIKLSYGIGYGEYHRIKELDGVRFGRDWEVFVNHNQEENRQIRYDWPSDYARQHQVDLSLLYTLASFSDKCKLNIGAGVFYSRISHYYIMGYVRYAEFEFFGPKEMDLLLISDQRFYTIGQRTEVNLEIQGKNLIYSPYIALGLGPNYTNFGTVGFRIIGALKGWKE
jgi:hypothetical protein